MKSLSYAVLLIGLATPAAAQTVSGNWITEFDRILRNENGTVSGGGEKARARLALQQKGDSVVGTWQLISAVPPGRPAPAVRNLRGTIAGDKVTLVSDPSEARLNRDGQESVVKMTTTYEFTIGKDALKGSMVVSSDQDGPLPAREFSAWREKP